MKKKYVAPTVEFEYYELNTSIAASCTTQVNSGPKIGAYTGCSDFGGEDGFDPDPFQTFTSARSSFYDNVICECYYTSSGEGYFTS